MLSSYLVFHSMSYRLQKFCNAYFIHDSLYFECDNDRQMEWVRLAIMNIKSTEDFQVEKFY